jgi:hypothetical protein
MMTDVTGAWAPHGSGYCFEITRWSNYKNHGGRVWVLLGVVEKDFKLDSH